MIGWILLFASCASLKKGRTKTGIDFGGLPEVISYCDTAERFESIFIGKISAEVEFEGERYDTRLSIYYVPDSIIYLSAVNSGFEIIRALMTPDSTIMINRLDKLVYFHDPHKTGFLDPIFFQDVEILINRLLICDHLDGLKVHEDRIFLDRSVQDVSKVIQYGINDLNILQFEFFQKKSNEYIVGELNEKDQLVVYSNYMIDDIKITAGSGTFEINRRIEVNMKVNERKYISIEI